MRTGPIRDGLRRNIGRRRRADIRRLLVDDVRNLGRTWSVGSPRMLEHVVGTCNLGTRSIVVKADLKVGLYQSHS